MRLQSDARPRARTLVVLTLCALAACVDLASPSDEVTSLSRVKLPLPGVVVGDTMRDSTGAVAPLHAVAYNKAGDSIPVTLTYVVLDPGAHTAGDLLIGDVQAASVKVVASSAAIQTLPVTVAVTLSPDTIVAADSTLHHLTFSLTNGDTVATSGTLNALVRHLGATPSGVDAVIVQYTITQAPPDNGSGPSVVLVNGNASSARDTTSGGVAGRALRLRVAALTNVIADTAVVTASASYRGHVIGTVEFTVVFSSQ
jgi:hypothetical protein